MKTGSRVWHESDAPETEPGRVVHELRRHRGPATLVVRWPDGWESIYDRDELLSTRQVKARKVAEDGR